MKCFEHNGDKCISINGKDYFLLRGYEIDYNKFIFVQVAGNTPLRKEDMPSKDWEIIRTKAGSLKVWTAYKKAYFKYTTDKDSQDLVFVGATSQGSYFLALRWLVRKFNQNISDAELNRRACDLSKSSDYISGLKKCQDRGNSGEESLVIKFGYSFDEDDANRILKGGKT